MDTITLTDSEVAYIVHILWKYTIYDQKILDVVHILTMKLPVSKDKVGEGSDKKRV